MGEIVSETLEELLEIAKIQKLQFKDIVSYLIFDLIEHPYSVQFSASTPLIKVKLLRHLLKNIYLV